MCILDPKTGGFTLSTHQLDAVSLRLPKAIMNRLNRSLQWVVCSLLLGLNISTTRADYPAKILANDPVVYWRLNDKAQVPDADLAHNTGSVGAAANGYFTGTATHPVTGAMAGNSDTAANFDGTAGSAVTVPYTAAMNPSGAFTVEAWLQPNAELAAGGLTAAVSSGQFAAPRSGWLIYQSDTGWSFRMYNQNGTTASVTVNGGTVPVVGTWYHVVAVYDGTTAKLYVNGAEVGAGTPTGFVASAGGPFFIGGRADNNFWWNGVADEVAIYSKALSAATIASHYQNGSSATPATPYNQLIATDAPIGYFRLNEPAYTPAASPVAVNSGTGGAGFDGAYNPGVNNLAAGPRPPTYSGFAADNTAAGLNGNAGYVSTPYNMNDLAEFTLTGWIKRGATHSSRGGYFGQNDLFEIGDADNGANIEIWINAYGTNIKIPYPFKDNEWGFLALVGDADKTVLYTNGFPAATVTHALSTFGSSTYNFNIGGGGIFNASGDYFLGDVDEVAVFDKALTAAQILDAYYGANIAPVISQQPVAPARTLVVGNYVTLSVASTGTAPLTYQWRKGGQNLAGQTSSTLNLNGITQNDAGSYDVVVSNAYGSATSNPVTLTVGPAETTPPTIQYADSGQNFNTVRLIFSEPLDPVSAQNKANYTISDGTSNLAVTSATLVGRAGQTGDNMVDLVTAAQTPGKTYTVTINGVKDQTSPANTIAANSTVQFTAWKFVSGYLRFEHYDNITGAADSDIDKALQDPRVIAGNPTTDGFITGKFDTRTIFPDDSHEHYLGRITGYIVPKDTDDYYFFLRSDDAGRLYLSTTESIPDPAVDTPIAAEPGCCGPFYNPDAGDPATTATPIRLEAGKRYGVLAFVKEHEGGDYLQVAWRKASDTTDASVLPYLSGEFFGTFVDPNTDVKITTQPTDQPGVLPSPVLNFATNNFTLNDGGYTVTNTEPPPPGPFVYDAAAGGWVAQGSEDACTGPYTSKLTSPAYTVPVSDEVTLTFTHRYSFEADRWDGGQVLVSVNGGAFTPVDPANFTANGYPPGLIQGSGVLNGLRVFHDDSPGYATGDFITSSVILGSFNKNDTVVVQFLGGWDDCSSGSHPSWVIKNVSLDYGTAPRATTFTAAATATKQGAAIPFAYQWQRNDGSGWVDMAGENAATLRIFPTPADFSAQFRVVAKVPGNEVISNVVKLTGGTAPPAIAIAKSGTTATITFTGTLQSSPTVNGTYNNVTGATNPYTVPAGTTMMFYRSVK